MMFSGLRYRPHARVQMRRRHVTEDQVEAALRNYLASWPAPELQHTKERCTVYTGHAGERILGVYILVGSDPPVVKTVVWIHEGGKP